MVEKPIPQVFEAKWNNHKSKLRIDLPEGSNIKHGDKFECYINKDGSVLYKKLGVN